VADCGNKSVVTNPARRWHLGYSTEANPAALKNLIVPSARVRFLFLVERRLRQLRQPSKQVLSRLYEAIQDRAGFVDRDLATRVCVDGVGIDRII